MTTPSDHVIFDAEARRFLSRTGVRVILIEVVVLAAVWLFQAYYGR